MSSKEWISVKDRLPKNHDSVLVVGNSIRSTALYENGIFYSDFKLPLSNEVTHWQPLPEPPKPKELKDLKEGDFVWAIGDCIMNSGKLKGKNVLTFGKKYKVMSVDGKSGDFCIPTIADDFHWFVPYVDQFKLSPYPPTPAQIEAAEEAAINEVKARFDRIKKEVQGDN
jgi:hypothetical protein